MRQIRPQAYIVRSVSDLSAKAARDLLKSKQVNFKELEVFTNQETIAFLSFDKQAMQELAALVNPASKALTIVHNDDTLEVITGQESVNIGRLVSADEKALGMTHETPVIRDTLTGNIFKIVRA